MATAHRGSSAATAGRATWLLASACLLAALVGWLLIAHHVLGSGQLVSQSWDHSVCLSNAKTWAGVQAVIGLAGFALGVSGLTSFWQARRRLTGYGRLALAGTVVLLLAWIGVVLLADPRDTLDAYAGCGLG